MRVVVKALALLLLTLTLLSGCTAKLVYNQLGWLVPLYFDNYLALNGEQKKMLNGIVDRQIEWHRQHELPRYAAFLEKASNDLASGLTLAAMDENNKTARVLWDDLITQLLPDIATLMSTLSDEQVAHLFKKWGDDLDSFATDSVKVSEKKQRANGVKNTRDLVETWVGSLNKEQRKLIDRWASEQYVPLGKETYQYQLAWLDEYRAAMSLRQNQAELAARLRRLLVTPEQLGPPEYQKQINANTSTTQSLMVVLDATFTPEQRASGVKKLRSYASDFSELAKRRGG
jgi:hypothetical protein